MLVQAAGEGKLSTRADASRYQGNFHKIVQSINDTLDAVIGPLRFIADHIKRLSEGAIPRKITTSFNGDFNEIINVYLNRELVNVYALAKLMEQVANADLTIVPSPMSENDMWSDKLAQMVNNLRELIRQMQEATDNISQRQQ